MKKSEKEPVVPVSRGETVRKEIISVLRGRVLSLRDISGEVRVSEKTVLDNLQHIQRTLLKENSRLTIIPAECRKCGFVFRKREKLKKPGKCPVCRSEMIKEPLFSIE
jgi:predicted Zn-ribbon and HTH transcriptional regulator